jgi:hypothetical protein
MENVMELITSGAVERPWLVPTIIVLILLLIAVAGLWRTSNQNMKRVKEAMKDPITPPVAEKASPPAIAAPVASSAENEDSSSDDSSTSSSNDDDYPGPGDYGPTPGYGGMGGP